MDIMAWLAAMVLALWAALWLVGNLFFIGRQSYKVYTATNYLIDACIAIAMLIVAGRVFGLW